ncbi:hypothetical protein ACA910_005927 [Epithemia clementina (nom. ined.)]
MFLFARLSTFSTGLLALIPCSYSFSVYSEVTKIATSNNKHNVNQQYHLRTGATVNRRQSLEGLVTAFLGTTSAVLIGSPTSASADVASGNELPKGAQQFNRIIRLRSDLKKVKKRVAEGSSEIDKEEWDNIGKFLRQAFAVGDDMKAVSAGINNPENKKKALDDIEQLRKYAQAADVSVNKQDGQSFVSLAEKMEYYVNDFFQALIDVPDEI